MLTNPFFRQLGSATRGSAHLCILRLVKRVLRALQARLGVGPLRGVKRAAIEAVVGHGRRVAARLVLAHVVVRLL